MKPFFFQSAALVSKHAHVPLAAEVSEATSGPWLAARHLLGDNR